MYLPPRPISASRSHAHGFRDVRDVDVGKDKDRSDHLAGQARVLEFVQSPEPAWYAIEIERQARHANLNRDKRFARDASSRARPRSASAALCVRPNVQETGSRRPSSAGTQRSLRPRPRHKPSRGRRSTASFHTRRTTHRRRSIAAHRSRPRVRAGLVQSRPATAARPSKTADRCESVAESSRGTQRCESMRRLDLPAEFPGDQDRGERRQREEVGRHLAAVPARRTTKPAIESRQQRRPRCAPPGSLTHAPGADPIPIKQRRAARAGRPTAPIIRKNQGGSGCARCQRSIARSTSCPERLRDGRTRADLTAQEDQPPRQHDHSPGRGGVPAPRRRARGPRLGPRSRACPRA